MLPTNVVQKTETHISLSMTLFFPESHAFYEIMQKNIVERGRPQTTIWCIRITCRITEPTDTHSEYAILTAVAL
jgi:hypothetical protein